MKVLSILNGHHATAALSENGNVLKIYHEEKFNNIKNYSGFPEQSLEKLHEDYDLTTVDHVVFCSAEQFYVGLPKTEKQTGAEALGKQGSKIRELYNILEYLTKNELFFYFKNFVLQEYVTPKTRKILEKHLKEKYNISSTKISYRDHHTNHALTPLYFYGLDRLNEDILLITIDGAGDSAFSKIFIYHTKDDSLEQIAESTWNHSIGGLYSEMTKFLGMKPNEHEYKVMGLAAYVTNEKYFNHIYEELKKTIWLNKNTMEFETAFATNVAAYHFWRKFGMDRFDNCAAAIQKLTEELVLEYIQEAIKKTDIHTIAVSGGVFMNVKMNQKIMMLPEVARAYFQPSASDESLVVGAAANVFRENNIKLKPIKTMFLGLEYTNNEVETFLKEKDCFDKYDIEYYDNIEKKSAELLADFKIVPRFKGQGEWGARSLCNRAILGNSSDLKTFYTVNDQVKMRDFWMPFAPTIMEEWADKYIKEWNTVKEKAFDSTKYMILTFDSTELAKEHLRAAMHQKDGTLRPQIVSKEDSPSLHKLLGYYADLTGMGGLMNTSLNIHGYPLVGTLEQALFTFEGSGLEYLTLENFLIHKKG